MSLLNRSVPKRDGFFNVANKPSLLRSIFGPVPGKFGKASHSFSFSRAFTFSINRLTGLRYFPIFPGYLYSFFNQKTFDPF